MKGIEKGKWEILLQFDGKRGCIDFSNKLD